MSTLLARRPISVKNSSSALSLQLTDTAPRPRYLSVDGKRAYLLGNFCDTCAFFFERCEGANRKFSPTQVSAPLRAGLQRVDDDLLSRASAILPSGDYEACLLRLVPELVTPGSASDYFTHEQPDAWGKDYAEGPVDPKTAYYRASDSLSMRSSPGAARLLAAPGEGNQLFEFIIPLLPIDSLEKPTVAAYRERLLADEQPTALAISILDVKQSADAMPDVDVHWCLAHYLLDGHHKIYASSLVRKPITLLCFIAIEFSPSLEAEELLGPVAERRIHWNDGSRRAGFGR